MISQTGGHGDDWHVCGAQVGLLAGHLGMPSAVVDGPVEMWRKVRELVRAGADVIEVAAPLVRSDRDGTGPGHRRALPDHVNSEISKR